MTSPFLLLIFCFFVQCLTLPTNPVLLLNVSDHINGGFLSLIPSPWDPRLQLDSFTADVEISDRSSYMTCLAAQRDLALRVYTLPMLREDFVNPSCGNVAIVIKGVFPKLEVRHAMWAIIPLLRVLDENMFMATKLRLFWVLENQAPLLLGELSILARSGGPNVLEFEGNPTAAKRTGPPEVTQTTTTIQLPQLLNSSESDNDVSIGQNVITSLDAPRRKVFFELEGASLSKLGILEVLAAVMVRYAEKTRHPFTFSGVSQMHGGGIVKIDISLYDPSEPDQSVIYEDLLYMLYQLPRAMYKKNKFREGTFVLEMQGRPLVEGKISKIRTRPFTGVLDSTSVAIA